MDSTPDNEERLREALLELNTLREREARALRDTNVLLNGLAAITRADSPEAGLRAFLDVMKTEFSCDMVLLARQDDDALRVAHATDPRAQGLVLPDAILAKPRVRRFSDVERVPWWQPGETVLATMTSYLGAPMTLQEGGLGAVICLAAVPDHFSGVDHALLSRLATLASQALANLAFAERNALLAAVIEGMSAGVSIADATDPELPLIYVNPAFLEMTGYESDEVLGSNCRFLNAEPKTSAVRVALRETVASRTAGTFDLRNVRKDGQEFWNRLTLFPIAEGDGPPRLMVATQVDVTAEREAETERDAARKRLIEALSSTAEGFLLLDHYGDVVFANPMFRSFYELPGIAWDDGLRFADLWRRRLEFLGDDPEDALAAARERQNQMFAGSRDREETLPDGRVLMLSAYPTGDGGAVVIASDITRLKVAERVLAQRAVAMDTAKDGIAVTDSDGRFVFMNPSHREMFGFEGEIDVLGRHWAELYDEDQFEAIESRGIPALMRYGVWRGTTVGRHRDGHPVPQEISLTITEDGGIVCVTRDITDRLRGEAERERLTENLQSAQRQEAIGQLAAGVAHDFNNVLAAINGATSLLQLELPPEDKGQVHARRILDASQRASDLVRRLLDLGARKREAGIIDLCDAVREATDFVRSGVGARIEFTVDVPETPVLAEADPTDAMQVLLNLAINARDACPQVGGRLRLALAVAEGERPDDLMVGVLDPEVRYAVMSVTDNGSGIPDDVLARIFDPYFSTKGADGTGLGLAVVATIMQAVHGAIRVETGPGAGTTFEIYWPLTATRGEGDTEAGVDEPVQNALDDLPSLDGCTVLVCDDEEMVGQVIAEMLERAGAEVATCVDPEDALEAIEEDPEAWTLLLTDFNMPGMSGLDLARKAKAVVPTLPVILLSAFTKNIPDKRQFEAILNKPANPQVLISAVGKAISGRGTQGDP